MGLGLVYDVGYLLFLGWLAGLFGVLERARRARPRQATSARSLSLAWCSAVAGLVLIGLAAAAAVANLVQLSDHVPEPRTGTWRPEKKGECTVWYLQPPG